MGATRTTSGVNMTRHQSLGPMPSGTGVRSFRKRHIITAALVLLGFHQLFTALSKGSTTEIRINVSNGEENAQNGAQPPQPTYDMMEYVHAEKIREPPVCDPSNPRQGYALQNLHRSQCIIYNSTELYMHNCLDKRVVRFCVNSTSHRLQTVDGKCIGVSDEKKASVPEARLSFYECLEDYKPFGWGPGGLMNMQLMNENFLMEEKPMCLDVLHQRRDAPVIQWKCKGEKNYKPTNQLWYWI